MESFSCALAAHDSDFRRWTTDRQPQILPELSNFYCLPGRAGGSPGVTSDATFCVEENDMPVIAGFDKLASVLEEQITDKIQRRVISGKQGTMVYWRIRAGAHVA